MEWIELGKLGKVSTGNTPSKKKIEYYNENYIELVKPSNFTENMIVNIESGEEYLSKEGKSKGRVAEVGDILVTCIGNIGNVGIVSKEVCFNQQINSIKVDKKKVLSKYIAYAILYIKPALNHAANKAVVPIINKSTFEKMKIPVPPVEIQKKIVEVLDEAQKLIDNRKKQIKLLDDLIESIFYDMFGGPVKNNKGWEMGSIRDLTEYTQYGTSKKASNTGEFPILRMGNITYEGNWDFSDLKYIDLDEKDKEKYLVQKGDLLFNRMNSKELVGKTAVYRETKPMAYAGYLIELEPNSKGNTEYISAYLNCRHGKATLLNMAKNIVGMANINAQELQDIKIAIPPLPLQNQFAEKVQAIEKQKELLQESLKLMEDNYNSLMQRAFKGELF